MAIARSISSASIRSRMELRIPAGTDSQDALLENQIRGRTSRLSPTRWRGPSGRQVTASGDRYYLPPATKDDPLVFSSAPALKSITEIGVLDT